MDKKQLLKKLEEHFGEKPKYMGPPSFAYQVKVGDKVYIIDREGKIKTSEGTEIELKDLLDGQHELDAPEPNDPGQEVIGIESETLVDRMEVTIPIGEHTGVTLRNLINMMASKQSLILQAFDLETLIINEEFVKAINERPITTIEDFKVTISEIGTDKCPGIDFDFQEGTITFKFYEGELNADKLKAYTDLVAAINQNAKTLKHASMKPTNTDNPKYSFRTWLLRLGMIGEEYKTTRKVLLANLKGNGAFRKPKEENCENETSL